MSRGRNVSAALSSNLKTSVSRPLFSPLPVRSQEGMCGPEFALMLAGEPPPQALVLLLCAELRLGAYFRRREQGGEPSGVGLSSLGGLCLFSHTCLPTLHAGSGARTTS